jgi:hypothetical protein
MTDESLLIHSRHSNAGPRGRATYLGVGALLGAAVVVVLVRSLGVAQPPSSVVGWWLPSGSTSDVSTSPHLRPFEAATPRPGDALRWSTRDVEPLPEQRALLTTSALEGEPFAYSKYATIVPDPAYFRKDHEAEDLSEAWGAWGFWDDAEDERPTTDYCGAFPYRDISEDEFPDESWQVDAVFVNHILDSGGNLVRRAQDAIFAEYGRGKPLPLEQLLERAKMFRWAKVDFAKDEEPSAESHQRGGWTTDRSWDGLVRRLLHAIVTNDDFVVVVVGGQPTVGAGNHFRHSYAMQFHRVVAPVLARLGVRLVTRNLSHRHRGSLSAALGAVWGGDVDIMIWDEGRIEHTRREKDLFLRQALLTGREKIPLIWMGGSDSDWELLRMYHEQADIDVGRFGTGLYGIPWTASKKMADSLPKASRYLLCEDDVRDLCRHDPTEYCAQCWIDRSDIPDPKALFPNITDKVPGHHQWNEGWRAHQLTGRLLAHTVLEAFQDAIQLFTQGTGGGPPLDDFSWHVGEYYENMRTKLANLSPTQTGCADWGDLLPARVCTTPLHGATQYTPRATSSIADLVKAGPSGKPVNPQQVMYPGHDVHNPCFDPEDGVANIVGVVSGRRQLLEEPMEVFDDLLSGMPEAFARVQASRQAEKEEIPPQDIHPRELESLETGPGWHVANESPGQCDGEYTSICGRQTSSTCPLLGYHDSSGQVRGDEAAGWLVLEIPNVEMGLIMFGLVLETQSRLRHADPIAGLPDSFSFDVSLDGKVTTWSKSEFVEHYRRQLQRTFDGLVLLDDPLFTTEAKPVEVAIRIRNCGAACRVGITHAFWA